jgi:hypothetical protein
MRILRPTNLSKAKTPNIAWLARGFDVLASPPLHSRGSRSTRVKAATHLSEGQEVLFTRGVRQIDSLCISPPEGMISDRANRTLRQNATDAETLLISKNSVYS